MKRTNKKRAKHILTTLLIVAIVLGIGIGLNVRACATDARILAPAEPPEQTAVEKAAELWDELATKDETEPETVEIISAEYVGEFLLTAYCCEKYEHICGTGDGITASGQPVQAGVSVAADPDVLPYGTIVYIEGIGIRIVQDTGGGLASNQIDIAMDTHENALEFGVQRGCRVYILSVNDTAEVG